MMRRPFAPQRADLVRTKCRRAPRIDVAGRDAEVYGACEMIHPCNRRAWSQWRVPVLTNGIQTPVET